MCALVKHYLITWARSVDDVRAVVLTSFFTQQLDPQRHLKVTPGESYMSNFFKSSVHNQLQVVIFYDSLPDKLIEKIERHRYIPVATQVPDSTTINDFRFVAMSNWLSRDKFDFILFADISDVVFFRNPFVYMKQRLASQGSTLFLSQDEGKFDTSFNMGVLMRRCYPDDVVLVNTPKQVYNAGLWGGTSGAVKCILDCVAHEVQHVTVGRGNCNMPAFNMCIHGLRCQELINVDADVEANSLFNQFYRPEDCTDEYTVIHNKCNEWARIQHANHSAQKAEHCITLVRSSLFWKECDDS